MKFALGIEVEILFLGFSAQKKIGTDSPPPLLAGGTPKLYCFRGNNLVSKIQRFLVS